MPEWWFEATLASVVFGTFFIIWVALPPRTGESDLGSKVRRWVLRLMGRSSTGA